MKKTDWTNRKTEDFGAGNGKLAFNMPLGGKVLMVWVIVRGLLTLAAGGGNNGTAKDELPAGLIQRIRVRVAKSQNSRYPDGLRVDAAPRSILRENTFQRRKFIGELAGSVIGSGAAGAYNIYQAIPIYFADRNLGRPIETSLNADMDAIQSLVVEVDTGSRDTMFTGNDRVWDYSALKVDVVDYRTAADGDTYCTYLTDHDVTIYGAKTRLEDKVFPTDGSIISLLLMAQNTAANTLADTILNGVKLQGSTIDLDLNANDIKQSMYDFHTVDTDQTIAGLYYLGFASGGGGGRLTNGIPAAGLDVKFDVLNPGGAGLDKLGVVVRRLFAPSGYTPIAA